MKSNTASRAVATLCISAALCGALVTAQDRSTRPRIAVFSGPNATIQNNKPLVTSNKAREQYGLPLQRDASGQPLVDWPRYQRLAAPVIVYVEMFTAHPLEGDAKELYAPPDGYVDTRGVFSKTRTGPNDKPVYAVTLKPEDGLYALPYMGRQANGQAWTSGNRRRGLGSVRNAFRLPRSGSASSRTPRRAGREDGARQREWSGASELGEPVHRRQQADRDKGPPAFDSCHHEVGRASACGRS